MWFEINIPEIIIDRWYTYIFWEHTRLYYFSLLLKALFMTVTQWLHYLDINYAVMILLYLMLLFITVSTVQTCLSNWTFEWLWDYIENHYYHYLFSSKKYLILNFVIYNVDHCSRFLSIYLILWHIFPNLIKSSECLTCRTMVDDSIVFSFNFIELKNTNSLQLCLVFYMYFYKTQKKNDRNAFLY